MKFRILALACLLALTAAACGEEDATAPAGDSTDETETGELEAGETETGEPEAGETEPDPTETGEPEAAGADVVVTVAGTEHGDVLVDGDGSTLYMFESDGGGASTCYDDCVDNWPPLLADGGAETGEGADEALLDTIERTDGSMQVTYDSHPLYHFAGDSAPGDVAGQGVGDLWWVLGADGEPVRDDGADDSAYDY